MAARPKGQFLHHGIRIVHEDEEVMVVDKPAGIVTANLTHQRVPSVFDVVKEYIRDQARRRGTRVWIIHRLDKEVSGLLVFAKTERAFLLLKEEFRTKRAGRIYQAVVEGTPPQAEGTVQSFLFEDAKGKVHSSATPSGRPEGAHDTDEESDGKLAVTHYRVVTSGHSRSLVDVKLETGRKNQIRVHLADLKCPIVGDRRYGASSDPLEQVCLHGRVLEFTHPATSRPVRFESPPPGGFAGLVGAGETAKAPPAAAARSTVAVPASQRVAPASHTAADQSWDHVADWYDQLIDDRGSDHHELVILPGTLRLLEAPPGSHVLDVACGQGVLCRKLAALGVKATGVDASPRLIEVAKKLVRRETGRTEFVVGDARELGAAVKGPFDGAACVMALMNIEPLSPLVRSVASLLRPGGVFVSVVLHPAFRSPGQTSWGWDEPAAPKKADGPKRPPARGPGRALRQYRRVDGYLSPGQREIVMNPGAASDGAEPVTTVTYHRPVQAYVRALADAGLVVDALEEWASRRVSQPGPRAAEENRARNEIPMFLAIRARKPGASDQRGAAS